MPEPTSIIVLCEDRRQGSFVWNCLRNSGIKPHKVILRPAQLGSGEKWVRDQFASEVNGYRKQKGRITPALIVVIDADTGPVQQRLRQLDEALQTSPDPRNRAFDIQDEMIARLVPKRNIETWLLALSGQLVEEATDFKSSRTKDEWDILLKPAAVSFSNAARTNVALAPTPPESLQLGVVEMRRFMSSW